MVAMEQVRSSKGWFGYYRTAMGLMWMYSIAALIVHTAAANSTTSTVPTDSGSLESRADFIFGICSAIVILLLSIIILLLVINLCNRTKKHSHVIEGNEEITVGDLELTRANRLTNGGLRAVPKSVGDQNSRGSTSSYRSYENEPPTISHYPRYVHRNRQSREIVDEFESLPQVQIELQTYGREEVNRPKNRYKNILPYNNSRVVLQSLPEDPFSDYINASYIDSFDRKKAYIASQGPKKNTFDDFWRMIWQEMILVISMLTRLEEGLKKKCDCYWPCVGETQQYGDIAVMALKIEERDFGMIRTFIIKKVSTSEEKRELTQYQFTKWPDKSVPKNTATLLRYLREVKSAYRKDDTGPLLVHCSAGIGRTGVVIALDSVVDEAKETDKVNVHGFVRAMRENRQNMVQTDEQYEFLHEAILESLMFEDTLIPIAEFGDRLERLRGYEEDGIKTFLAKEFDTLNTLCPDPLQIAIRTGSRHDNIQKNRDSTILPIERNRAMIKILATESSSSDYINASFVRASDEHSFIVTQMPLPETVVDFWAMIFDYKPTRIVMLNRLDKTEPTCTQYWPDGGSTQYGPFTVSTTSTEKHVGMIVRTLQVQLTNTENVRVVRQYQFLGWPGDNDKLSNQSRRLLMDLIDNVYSSSSGVDPSSKVLVHCNNGAGRSGVFCAVKMGVNQADEMNAVDVFQIVKSLRNERMRMVATEEEYLLCYEFINGYLNRKEDDDQTDDEADRKSSEETSVEVHTVSGAMPGPSEPAAMAESTASDHIYVNVAFSKDE